MALASRYLALITPCLYLSALSECIRKYLMAQTVVHPTLVATAVTTLLCPLYNWLLVYK